MTEQTKHSMANTPKSQRQNRSFIECIAINWKWFAISAAITFVGCIVVFFGLLIIIGLTK